MDFVDIENAGKRMFEQFPIVKKGLKRVYQLTSYALSSEKFKAEGDLTRVTPDDGYEYFYGYYDKSPWDATDRYMLALRVRQSYKSVAPKEPGVIVLIDTKKDNKIYKIAITHSWNVQQGCMAQWLGPDFHDRIIYNDFRDGHYCSVIYNLTTRSEEKVLPMPVYDVAKDGSFALTLDFSRLHRLRPGYGYSNLPDITKGELCPDKPCIWKIDLESGEVEELFNYTDFASFEPDPSMVGAEHKVNHIMISPNGKRFMVLHRWFQKGRKHTRLVTVNVDGTEMYNLSDDVFVSHSYWKNDEEILSFLRKEGEGDHYYLLKDRTQEYKLLWPELNTDGHCSYSPDRSMVITDTYPNRKRLASLYLCTEADDKARRIARVFSPFQYDNDCRCDLHPRWNHEGNKVCIDSVHEGKRGIYDTSIPDLKAMHNVVESGEKIPHIIHSIWLGNSEKSPIDKQCRLSWETFLSDYQVIEWNETNFDIEHSCKYAQEAYKAKKWAFVSDYVRLKALYEYGGIYLDADMEALRNIDSFLKLSGFLCAESKHTISTAIIAAEPHASWIKELLDEYESIQFINQDGSYNTLPNTKRMQAFLEKKYSYHWSEKPQELEPGFVIFPSEYFSPLNCYTGKLNITDRTYMYHHYDNTWKSSSEKLKKKVMQIGTRFIGEDMRYKLVGIKNHN